MFDRYGHDAVCKDIDDFMESKELSLFGMVCNVMNPATHLNEKTILMYSRENDPLGNTFEDLLAAMKESELLKTFNENRGAHGSSKYAYY